MKICSNCNETKDLTEFYKDGKAKDKLTHRCKSCIKEQCLLYSKSSAGKATRSDYNKKWSKINAHKKNASCRARQAQKLMAVPKWTSLLELKKFYKLAKELESKTGIRHEVDHIVPLVSDLICGLHCESNLRVIPWIENRIKGNLVWPDCPEIQSR